MTLLDFGCGSGALLRHLPGSRKIGVEVNPAAIEAVKSQGGIELYEDLRDVPGEIVDVALSNHALEHVGHPLEALRGIRRTLRQAGILVLCLPLDDWRTQRNLDVEDRNHHLHAWTPVSLRNLLVEAEFQVVHVSLFAHAWREEWLRWEPRVPRWLFDLLCRVCAVLFFRRQMIAVARKR